MSFRNKARKKALAAAASGLNAADVASIATANPYIKRLIEDAELRDSVKSAIDAARSAYGRIASGKVPAKVLLDDKKLHRDLRVAVDAIRDASAAISEAPKKRKRRRLLTFRRTVLLAGVGSAVAVATNEKLRSKLLDTLFGAEEEFEYTPPAPPASAPAPEQAEAPAAAEPAVNGAPADEAKAEVEAETPPAELAAEAEPPEADADVAEAPEEPQGAGDPQAAEAESEPTPAA